MPSVVWNPLDEPISTKMGGSFFTFKPDQKKIMADHMAHFVSEKRKETGLTVLPGDFLDKENEMFNHAYSQTPEGQAQLKECRDRAISNIIDYHKDQIRNLMVALKQDLVRSGEINTDPLQYASKGDKESIRIIAKYQRLKQDQEQKEVDEMKKLLEKSGI